MANNIRYRTDTAQTQRIQQNNKILFPSNCWQWLRHVAIKSMATQCGISIDELEHKV